MNLTIACRYWLLCVGLMSPALNIAAATTAADGTELAPRESTLQLPRYGEVAIYRPRGEPNAVMIFLSGDAGWRLGVVDMARLFATEGALVAGIDVRRYLDSIKPGGAGAAAAACTNVAADFEVLSQTLQHQLQLREYRHPVLAGYSSGASVAYAALAQAPRGTFSGVISLGFCPDQDFSGARLCRVNGADYSLPTAAKPPAHSLILKANARIRDPWIVAQGELDRVCKAPAAREFTTQVPAAELLALPAVGHGFSVTADWWPQLQRSYGAMVAKSAPLAPIASDVSDLPIYETARTTAAPSSRRIALLVTGDGGWAGLDRDLADALATRGIPTAALSSIRYFWKQRTPEQTAADLTRMIRHYLAAWQGERVLLLGYSFGADVVPFIYNRLPPELRARVDVIGIMGLSAHASFEFKLSEWLPGGAAGDLSTVGEIQRSGGVPTLCVMGDGEKDSACPLARSATVQAVTIGTGHHFSGKAAEIVTQLLKIADP
jgi:type IV secretory pathway VirJ component